MADLLVIPSKKTGFVNWAGYLKGYLSSLYGTADAFSEAIDSFSRCHDAIIDAPHSPQGRDLLYRYYGQLELLGMRVPLGGTSRLEFTWNNLFDNEEITQNAIAFEKACVLFNLGAKFSSIGASATDTKIAYASFQAAAGVFAFVAEHFLHTPTQDLAPASLEALTTLMLAQAQETFLKRASESSAGQKPGLRAKLAESAAELYDQAHGQLDALSSEFDWGDGEWLSHTQKASKRLKAQAHIDYAEFLEQSKKHGDAIAHLRQAKKLGEKQVSDMLKRLEKDNELVWHDTIPATASVIPATQTAKPSTIESLYASSEEASRVVGRDLFVKVVPLAVHEKASLYSEMQAELIRDETHKADVADQELRSALEYMDLPRAADLLRHPETMESELRTVPDIAKTWQAKPLNLDFDSQRQRILMLSESSAQPHQIKQSLVNAAASDRSVREMLDSVKDDVDILVKGTSPGQPLYQLFTEPLAKSGGGATPSVDLLSLDDTSSGSTAEFSQNLEEVSSIVARLRKVETERRAALRELREKVNGDDISSILVAHQKTENLEEAVFKPELAKFAPIQKRIDATLRLQQSLMSDLAAKWRAVLSSSMAKERASTRERLIARRQELVDRFQSAYDTWSAANAGAQKAATFYQQLEQMAVTSDNDNGIQHRASTPSVTLGGAPPALPPKPPLPSKQHSTQGQSGYTVPSAYDPSLYK